MNIQLRLPHITAETTPEQIAQIRLYLYQLVEQLQFIINNLPEQEEK